MVKSDIVQMITDHLYPYLAADGVCAYPSDGLTKYVANLRGYLLEIQYEFVDHLYRIRIEERRNNQAGYMILLSQSSHFHRVLKKTLHEAGLSKKEFKSHVTCLCKIVRKQLEDCGNLDDFAVSYSSDLKFDGIFL